MRRVRVEANEEENVGTFKSAAQVFMEGMVEHNNAKAKLALLEKENRARRR